MSSTTSPVEIVAGLIDPDPKSSKQEQNITPEDILNYLLGNNYKVNINNNKIEINLKNSKNILIEINFNNNKIKIKIDNYQSDTDCSSSSSCNLFIELLNFFKQEINKINQNIGKDNYKNVYFLFDTCYDRNKAEQLKNTLESIEGRLCGSNNGCVLFGKFLSLLASVYACMTDNAKYYERAEWFPLLARAAAGDGYLPVCPSKGDAVALVYYYITKFGTGSVTIDQSDVCEIIGKLVCLPQATCRSFACQSQQGSGSGGGGP